VEKDSFAPRQDTVYSKKLRAGKKRTYFFDVKKTKGDDYYVVLTESARRPDGSSERHKIFVYKEDFNRFVQGLNEVVDHVKTELMPHVDYDEFTRRQEEWEARNQEEKHGDSDLSW
jgi:hypothetical protein